MHMKFIKHINLIRMLQKHFTEKRGIKDTLWMKYMQEQ